MTTISEIIEELAEVANHPMAQLDQHRAAGKQVIGVGPYYVPEELVYAAGAIPFGVWGRMGTVSAARKYFAPFYCSMCQMTLEMGLNHELDKLSGMMVTSLCDTLRGFSQNFRVGVSQVPMIFVSQPQNRKTDAGLAYAIDSYQEARRMVGEACDAIIEDGAISEAIVLYNQWRRAMRAFLVLAASHPGLVNVSARSAVVNAGYYMDKAQHLAKVNELNSLLAEQPEEQDGFKRVVLSGIMYDIPAVQEMLDDLKYAIVADDIAKESRALQMNVPESGDPIEALAKGYCALSNDSILYDADKGHVENVSKLAQQAGAQGVILLMAKFCDPEEFDAPHVVKACRAAGIPIVQIEVDQSTETYEQARTKLEAFADLLA
jgi:benzoyl-CoA reductase/2-hydroxyglutaryl-CoA dehydratase subunit BcrC/BadD/HgdB